MSWGILDWFMDLGTDVCLQGTSFGKVASAQPTAAPLFATIRHGTRLSAAAVLSAETAIAIYRFVTPCRGPARPCDPPVIDHPLFDIDIVMGHAITGNPT